MSAALRINNKRKSTKISLPSESPFKDSGTSSPKSAAKKSRNRLRSPSPTMEHPLTPKSSTASSSLDKATPVADPDQVVCVDPSAQAAGATSDLPSANPSVMHASSLYADRIPVIDATSVASNTHLVAPVVNNNPLTTPSHSRYLLPIEKIERLSKKPTRAQVVQITTNLRRESCHYIPINEVLPENYDSFKTLLMLQYVMNPSKMEECTHWKHWDREKFRQELLSAVPDNSVVRPDSATTFVECIAQLFLHFNLADPAVEEAFACCQKMSQIKIPINAYKYTTSTYRPMECINIDFIGPYPDNGYVLNFIDTFTRWVELYPVPEATAEYAAKCLLQHFGRYGSPT
jgi:hypothetical protein